MFRSALSSGRNEWKRDGASPLRMHTFGRLMSNFYWNKGERTLTHYENTGTWILSEGERSAAEGRLSISCSSPPSTLGREMFVQPGDIAGPGSVFLLSTTEESLFRDFPFLSNIDTQPPLHTSTHLAFRPETYSIILRLGHPFLYLDLYSLPSLWASRRFSSYGRAHAMW